MGTLQKWNEIVQEREERYQYRNDCKGSETMKPYEGNEVQIFFREMREKREDSNHSRLRV